MRVRIAGLAVAATVLGLSAAAQVAPQTPSMPESLARVYEARSGAPIWLDRSGAPTQAGVALLATLHGADRHALPPARYRAIALTERLGALNGADAAEVMALEADLGRAFAAYVHDLSGGVLTPRRVDKEIHVDPVHADPGGVLAQIANGADAGALLAGIMPRDPEYARLLNLRTSLRRDETPTTWGPPVSKGGSLELGDVSPRVAEVRARLIAMGDHPKVEPARLSRADTATVTPVAATATDAEPHNTLPDPYVFDAALSQAVKRFQLRHGLNDDGIVGPATRAALNTEPADRLRQVAVNLERLRWLNRDLGARHIVVNIAGFTMEVRNGDVVEFAQRVVVGKARRHRTPEFTDLMDHMVVNPSWNVPSSIARNEILPKLRENPNYLAENNMELRNSDLPASEIDWNAVPAGTFPGRVRQRPGTGNALGRVKFMFPNQFAIYLHDTPSRSLFRRDVRAYSHGCVRVERPLEFAEYLLQGQVDDPAGTFQSWLDRGKERWVHLDRPVPVHLTYRTAWVAHDGTVNYRADIYGRDGRIAEALAGAGVALN